MQDDTKIEDLPIVGDDAESEASEETEEKSDVPEE